MPPTPQASLERGSLLPLSIRRSHPSRHARPGPPTHPRRSPGEHTEPRPLAQKAVASYRSPKRLRRGAGAGQSQRASALQYRLRRRRRPWSAGACSRFRSAGATHRDTHEPARRPTPAEARASTLQTEASRTESGSKLPQSKAASPRRRSRSIPKSLRPTVLPPTPQASLECGSLLPLSIRRGRPSRHAQPARRPTPAEARASTQTEASRTESGSKLPQSKAASPRRRSRSIPKRHRPVVLPPTPQASLDCGSLLPLSIRRDHPSRPARPGPPIHPRRSPGGHTNRGLSHRKR